MFMICTLHSDTSNLCTHEMIWSKAYNCNHPFRVNHVSLVRFDIFIFWQYTCKLWTFCSKFEDYIPFYLIGKKNLINLLFFAEHIKVNNVISCRNCFSGDNTHHSNERSSSFNSHVQGNFVYIWSRVNCKLNRFNKEFKMYIYF